MAVQTMSATPILSRSFHWAFVIAWVFCLLFYFMQYAVRSAPGVMIPELTAAFGLSALGVSSLLGVYYYTYSTFAIIAGASLDRWGAKYTIQIGIAFLAVTRKFLKCIFIFILSALLWSGRARSHT
jgi:fucose permease